MKANEIYDVSAELDRELGPVGSESRKAAIEKAWEEYNAQVLLDARKAAGMTQSQVAERIGVTKSYISRVERGQIVPTIASFYKMVSAMGLAVELRPR